MANQTKSIEILTHTYDRQSGNYSVSFFDGNIENSEIEETTVSEDDLLTYIVDNELNREEFINYNMRNLECDGLDERFINPADYLENNLDQTIKEYIQFNS